MYFFLFGINLLFPPPLIEALESICWGCDQRTNRTDRDQQINRKIFPKIKKKMDRKVDKLDAALQNWLSLQCIQYGIYVCFCYYHSKELMFIQKYIYSILSDIKKKLVIS